MVNFVEFEDPVTVVIGDAKLKGVEKGDVELEAFHRKKWYQVVLRDVLFVPKMTVNLFPITQLFDKGYVQVADANSFEFKTSDGTETIAVVEHVGRLFKMKYRMKDPNVCILTTSIKIWHETLAHQNVKCVRDILNRNKIDYIDDWGNHVHM